MITFTDNSKKNIVPYLIFGFITVTFGVAVYLLLPLALISQNVDLLLNIFFAILFGMLVGLTLMTTNVVGIFELIMTYLLFFWEKKSLLNVLKKNMSSHKARNKLTTIIYSLSLGSIVFLLVASDLQIQTITLLNTFQNTDIVVSGPDFAKTQIGEPNFLLANYIDDTLIKYADKIRDFGYTTGKITQITGPGNSNEIHDIAFLNKRGVESLAVSPSTLLDDGLSIDYASDYSGLGYTEQLYSARGSQGAGLI